MKKIIAALTCAAIPMMSSAEEPRYTYLEGGYQAIDLDDLDVDGDGFGIGGSLGITDRVHLKAAYSDLDLDFGIDVSSYELGIGGSLPLSEPVHLVGEVGYTKSELDSSIIDADDDGYFLSGGFRWMASPQFELNAFINYVDLDDSGDDTSLSVGALYSITDDLAVGAGIDRSDDVTGYSIGLRYYFPTLN